MKTTEQNYMTEMHQEYREWLQNIAFYEDELKILKKQLSELSSKNTAFDIKTQVEKFQNQFIIQKNEIDILKHDIQAAEKQLEQNVIQNPVAVERRKMNDDGTLRDRISTFVFLFKEMKSEFLEFARQNF